MVLLCAEALGDGEVLACELVLDGEEAVLYEVWAYEEALADGDG